MSWPRLTVDSLDAKETRRSMVECKVASCGKSKATGAKLFACAGCKCALYCSRECQKKDWPRHKRDCLMTQENKVDMNSQPDSSTKASTPTNRPQRAALPSEVSDELSAFRKHFLPTLTLVAINAFCDIEKTPTPRRWEDHLFLVQLERVPNPSPSLPAWARFRLAAAGPYPVELLFPKGKEIDHTGWRNSRDEAVARNLSMGLGTITLCVSCNYQGMGLNAYSDLQFLLGAPIEMGVERVANWKDVLLKHIENESRV